MSGHPALETLRRATNAYRLGQAREALALAEAAYRIATEIPGAPPQVGTISSFYGLLLGTVGRRPEEGLGLCREAAGRNFWEPEVYEHMARLQMSLGERRAALETIERGLALSPEDRGLLEFRQSLGVRRSPPVPFLDRSHPVNRWMGMWRARTSGAHEKRT